LKPEQFIDILNKVCTISDNLGIPVHEMPEYTRQEEERLKEIKQDINDLQLAKIKVLQDHNVTINTLREYERNKPVADDLVATKKEIEKVEKERHSYKIDLEYERLWKRKEEENRWLILVEELDKANRELGCSTNSSLVRKCRYYIYNPSTVSCPIFNTYRLIYDNKLVLNKRSILFKQMIICL